MKSNFRMECLCRRKFRHSPLQRSECCAGNHGSTGAQIAINYSGNTFSHGSCYRALQQSIAFQITFQNGEVIYVDGTGNVLAVQLPPSQQNAPVLVRMIKLINQENENESKYYTTPEERVHLEPLKFVIAAASVAGTLDMGLSSAKWTFRPRLCRGAMLHFPTLATLVSVNAILQPATLLRMTQSVSLPVVTQPPTVSSYSAPVVTYNQPSPITSTRSSRP